MEPLAPFIYLLGMLGIGYVAAGVESRRRHRKALKKGRAALYLAQSIVFADEEDRRKRALDRVGNL